MAIRFCPQCGTQALPDARFCHGCGTALAGGAQATAAVPHRASGPPRRATALGFGVLGAFLVAGLGIWTAILSPDPPKPGPGGAAPRPPATAATGPAQVPPVPPGHPQTDLPADVKEFIADLGRKAKEKPKDVEAWLTFARVNARAARIDRRYGADGVAAYQHVLGIDAKNAEALRGLANLHYDREEHLQAIPFFEKYLAQKPDDAAAATDLATMYLYVGDPEKAIATYKDVIKRHPTFIQAHYNLGVTLHQQGDDKAALQQLEEARKLAPDDDVRKQVDELIAALKSGRAPRPPSEIAGTTAGGGPPAAGGAPTADGGSRTPYQQAVEQAFRGHPIMGPRIVGFEWSSAVAGRVLLRDFPMEAMPAAVRDKFTGRLADELRGAQAAAKVDGAPRMELADASSGAVMATVTP
jgi:cytochrome c-type biogenesis protein CcmH/NrfG